MKVKGMEKMETKAERKLPRGITRCKDGRFQGRYTYEGHRYCIYDRDLKELERKMNDIRYEIDHGMYAKQDRISLNSWYKTWIEDYKSMTVKKGTIESYDCMYQYYVKPVLGKKLLQDIRGEHIQKFYNDMVKEGYSKSTISLVHVLLKSMFKQALKNELVKKNPVDLATLPRGEKKKPRRVLSRQEQEILISYVKGHELEPIILLALASGMRIGELLGLEWNDIDFEKKEIHIRGTLKELRTGGCYKDFPKTENSKRIVPLLMKSEQMLKRTAKKQKEQKLQAGREWEPVKGLENLVFTRENGKPFTGQHVRQQLNHIVDAINEKYYCEDGVEVIGSTYLKEKFEYFTPHALRHTFATRALENGIPPKVVQEILGHSSITLTLDLYTHVMPQTKAKELEKIGRLV